MGYRWVIVTVGGWSIADRIGQASSPRDIALEKAMAAARKQPEFQ